MLFNSATYLFFLLVVITAYYRLPLRGRRLLLLGASYVFYWFWSIPFSLLLVASTVIDWSVSLWLERLKRPLHRKLALSISCLANLGLLGLFKYADFFSDSAYGLLGVRPWPELDLILPLGISFYTFQTMSYTIDVFRGHIRARKSILDVALYVSFFPQLVAGPIVRADVLMPQLCEQHGLDWGNIQRGIGRIIWGMVKKVYIADAAAHIVNDAYADAAATSGFGLLMATYAFAIQIYCDFSGYSDIAIGSALLLGIKLPENFRSPYLALSIREFWRRWHISLSTWLRDYLYIPLGGSRLGAVRTYVNLMITMLLGGLWHGAGWNWVVWGGLQGAVMSAERLFGLPEEAPRSRALRLVRWIATFHVVCISWVLFRAGSMEHALLVFERIFTWAPGVDYWGLLPLGYLAVLLIAELTRARELWLEKFDVSPVWTRWVAYASAGVLLLTFQGASNPEFIYFQF